MTTMVLLAQATWLSKLHDAQEKYQETVKSRGRELAGAEATADPAPSAGARSHAGTLDAASPGPTDSGDMTNDPEFSK